MASPIASCESCADIYLCPGESRAISRAVHLARLQNCYDGCRKCRHRDDLAVFPPAKARRLRRSLVCPEYPPLFGEEDASGPFPHVMNPAVAMQLARSFGCLLWRKIPRGKGRPSALLGGDGRSITPEVVAALGEGMRWAGCDVWDAGPVTAACLSHAIVNREHDGGVLVGSPVERGHVMGLKFWARSPHGGGRPLSRGLGLDELRRAHESRLDRPIRTQGQSHRLDARSPYLVRFREIVHGLRPLRFVMGTTCLPFVRDVQLLIEETACRMIPVPDGAEELGKQVARESADFGLRVGDDGRQTEVCDGDGILVPVTRLLPAILRSGVCSAQPVVVLDDALADSLTPVVEDCGGRVVGSTGRLAAIDLAMRMEDADLAATRNGTCLSYRAEGGGASPDALMTLSILLNLLSRQPRTLTEVLDDLSARS